MHELVIGRTKDRIARARTEASAINQALRMLDAKADGERLRLDMHAAIKQHLESIAGAVPDGENDMIGAQRFAFSFGVFGHDRVDFIGRPGIIKFNINHLVLEAKFTA